MRKIALIALSSLPLFAGFFPQTVHTSISKVTDKSVVLKSSFPVNGMSGVVIHNYGNGLEAIISRMVQTNSKTARLTNSNIVHHDELPTINTAIKKNDKVIGGYLYRNVLLLAPDAQTYAKITSIYDRKWIHPDLFALYLSKKGDNVANRENLSAFAKAYQVGLIFIIGKGTAKLLDPISGKIVAKKSMLGLPKKGEAPFFMRFDEIESGMFSSNNKQGYYKLMEML
jgi:hypothetical protein